MTEPRRLSGGREADILDLGDGTVLRQRVLPAAAARRVDDPNVTDRERRAVRRLVEHEAA